MPTHTPPAYARARAQAAQQSFESLCQIASHPKTRSLLDFKRLIQTTGPPSPAAPAACASATALPPLALARPRSPPSPPGGDGNPNGGPRPQQPPPLHAPQRSIPLRAPLRAVPLRGSPLLSLLLNEASAPRFVVVARGNGTSGGWIGRGAVI